MQQLQQDRSQINSELNEALQDAKLRGCQYARAERDYRLRLRQQILIERADKQPVTIVGDLARGCEEVAELKFKRDAAKTLYESAREAINIKKIQLRMVEDDIAAIRRGV